MPQAHPLVEVLKRALKLHGMTYRMLSEQLAVSEPTVKRLFAQGNFSLERLDQICRLMDMEIGDLVRMLEEGKERLKELSESQESELVADIRLLLVAFLVINAAKFEEILRDFRFSESELVRYLARLDKLRLIELLPKNRIKLLVSPNFAWRRNGPIQKFFTHMMQHEFLDSDFSGDNENFLFLSGLFTSASSVSLRRKLEQLASDFGELNRQDRTAPIADRNPYSLILAMRPWRPRAFGELRREQSKQA